MWSNRDKDDREYQHIFDEHVARDEREELQLDDDSDDGDDACDGCCDDDEWEEGAA